MLAQAIFKQIPMGVALYSVFAFASATPIAQLASASKTGSNGIWVQLCATGAKAFIPLGGPQEENGEPDTPMPASHSQACHACADRRFGDGGDDNFADDMDTD